MKKLLLLPLLLFIISCGKPKEDIIRENISSKLKGTMKNPNSFEFVSMEITKTFSVKERRKTINDDHLKKVRELNEKLPSPELLFQTETEYNFLKNQNDENAEATYWIDFTARGSNSFGGIITKTYRATVINDEVLTVVSLSEN